MTRPNFFIVGAPKSGTTALYQYLRQHPSVYMPLRKEPHHFAPDLYAPRYVYDRSEYLALFEDGGGKAWIGEASVYYLYSKVAAQRIREFDPQAKIIIMLRNPVDMIYSLHSQRLYSGYEDIRIFEEALEAEEDRKRGYRVPPHGYPIPCLFYREIGRIGEQVGRFLSVFPRDQIHVILFEKLKTDTSLEYERVCEFLGIESSFEPEWTIHNPNKRIRSQRLRTLLKFTPVLRRVIRGYVPAPVRRPLKNAIVSANTKYERRPALSEATRQRLQHEFAHDVQMLSRLLQIDCCHWLHESNRDTEEVSLIGDPS